MKLFGFLQSAETRDEFQADKRHLAYAVSFGGACTQIRMANARI